MIPTTQNQIFVITEWLNSFSDENVLTTSLAKPYFYKLMEEHKTQVSKKYRESLVGGDRDVLIPISGKLLLLIQCLHIVWLISTVASSLRSNWSSWYVCSCPHTSDFPQFSFDIKSEATNAFVSTRKHNNGLFLEVRLINVLPGFNSNFDHFTMRISRLVWF